MSKHNDYYLQIDLIDRQHQKFINIYNKSLELMARNGNNITDAEKLEIINELSDYMKIHFKTEENLMMLAHYPDIEKHIKEHIHYIDKIDEFVAAYKYRNPALFENMLVFMKKWFLSHIKKTDSKYISVLREYLDKNR